MKRGMELAAVVEKIMEFGPQMGGVFSTADLSSMIAGGSDLYNQRVIARLVRAGTLRRVMRGLYAAKNCDLFAVSARIGADSYVSMDSALAKSGLTGSVPQRSLSVVYTGRKKTIKLQVGDIHFYSIAPEFYFGFSRLLSGVNLADPEKAFIDLLYFHVKGARFLIDPLRDVDAKKLDRKKLISYLNKYRNPKFVKFVKGVSVLPKPQKC